MGMTSFEEWTRAAETEGRPLWKIVQLDDCRERQVTEAACFEDMRKMIRAMRAADEGYDADLRSASGLSGGDGAKLAAYRESGQALFGDFVSEVIEIAVKMAESNACMRRIVAAPTAGSCGVLPAVLLAYERYHETTEEKLVESLFTAAGIGEILAENASIAGAEGGCQAEIGSAAAMAAGAVTYLAGGDAESIVHAAAMAIKDLLGLTCDPVAGLVEVPCVKRNAAGAVVAVTAAQMALAGIRSRIEPDEVVDAMRRIGRMIPACLRETSEGGLAVTESARRVEARMQENRQTSDV